MEIKRKLVLSFTSTVLIPMLIICIVLSIMITSLSQKNYSSLAMNSLKLANNAMKIFFEASKQNVTYLSESPLLKIWIVQSLVIKTLLKNFILIR